MKIIYRLFLFITLLFVAGEVAAQVKYDISGIVTNEKGEPLKSATIFIGGSDRVTPTDENGKFGFSAVPQGNYQLAAQMIGYEPSSQNIQVKSGPLTVDIQLKIKVTQLVEVTIGRARRSDWENNFTRFKGIFLGESANARQTLILNPKAINFSTRKGMLTADADDFLIIENRRLGYRLHYQLKDFNFDSGENVVLYHGECTFEELDGTAEQKKEWARHREETYRGSFMHFLRSVYQKNTLENGFIARPMYGYGHERTNPDREDPYKIILKDRPVMLDSLLTALGTNFMSFKFNQLYVIYDPIKAANYKPTNKSDQQKTIIKDNYASIVKLVNDEAVIDQKGSYTDYRDFYTRGRWAEDRVADQLPVDYQPSSVPVSNNDNIAAKMVAQLQQWTDSIPQEKAYLHMDKPYYALGDTIWFKGYLTAGSRHQLSALSDVAHVDMVDEQNHPVKTLKLLVNTGTISGDFVLGDDIKAGNYRIRAYTQWMRNEGVEYFFDRTFTIGDPLAVKQNGAPNRGLQQTDVHFFPEGGNLVNDLASRVAFKAVGSNGLGTPVSGKIVDNDNNEVTGFTSQHAGMGSFLLKPQPGKVYTAKIRFADSTSKDIALPKALDEGYVLGVYQPNKDSVLVRIYASKNLLQSTVNLVVHSSGEVIFATPVKLDGAITLLWLEKKNFPSGIAQFTLFNNNAEPLDERIAFIKTYDHMHIAVKTAKPVYKSKEHVQLDLNATDGDNRPTAANFSVAVIDESKVPVDESAESTIFSHLLLSADIKGYVENPGYYFTADTDEVNKALDDLMLTQGYRRFEWKTLGNIINNKPVFRSEPVETKISGIVVTLAGRKPVEGSKVILESTKAKVTKIVTTDANGRFDFDKMFIVDSAKFAVQATVTATSSKVKLILDPIPQVQADPTTSINVNKNTADVAVIKAYMQKAKDEGKEIKLTGLHVLNQVEIRDKEIKKVNKDVSPQEMYHLPDEQSADKILTIPDPERYNNLEMFLQNSLQGISIQVDQYGYHWLISVRKQQPRVAIDTTDPPEFYGKAIGLIVNGRKILQKDAIDEILEGSIQPEDIAKIEVVVTNRAMAEMLQGYDKYIGYLLLITKSPLTRKQYDPSITNITRTGFNKSREFYSPKYDKPEDMSMPDLRTTIYWNPYVNTDANGKASFDFFNADAPGNYRVVIEGINAAGQLGRQVYRYKVE